MSVTTYQQIYVRGSKLNFGDMGGITISYRVNKLNKDLTDIGVAFSTPTDQFCKKLGRTLAQTRCKFHEAMYHYTLPVRAHEYTHVKIAALSAILTDHARPQWARDLVSDQLSDALERDRLDRHGRC